MIFVCAKMVKNTCTSQKVMFIVIDTIFVLGVDIPRDYDLPSPRLISNMMFNNTDGPTYDRRRTAELMAWGQLIAHDFVLTPTIDGTNEKQITIRCRQCLKQEKSHHIDCNFKHQTVQESGVLVT